MNGRDNCRGCAWSETRYEHGKVAENVLVGFGWKTTICHLPGGEYNDGKELSNPDGCCPLHRDKIDLNGEFD